MSYLDINTNNLILMTDSHFMNHNIINFNFILHLKVLLYHQFQHLLNYKLHHIDKYKE